MNHISWDLVRTIVEYVPLENLLELSKASPMFDKEICTLKIHIFYDKSIYGDVTAIILDKYSVIIQLRSGKKDILRINYDRHDTFCPIFYRSYRNTGSKCISPTNCIERKDKKYLKIEYNNSGVFCEYPIKEILDIDMINGIDFNRHYISSSFTGNSRRIFGAEPFRVIYRDSKWTP